MEARLRVGAGLGELAAGRRLRRLGATWTRRTQPQQPRLLGVRAPPALPQPQHRERHRAPGGQQHHLHPNKHHRRLVTGAQLRSHPVLSGAAADDGAHVDAHDSYANAGRRHPQRAASSRARRRSASAATAARDSSSTASGGFSSGATPGPPCGRRQRCAATPSAGGPTRATGSRHRHAPDARHVGSTRPRCHPRRPARRSRAGARASARQRSAQRSTPSASCAARCPPGCPSRAAGSASRSSPGPSAHGAATQPAGPSCTPRGTSSANPP